MINRIQEQLQLLPHSLLPKDLDKVERKLYHLLPKDSHAFVASCDEMMASRERYSFYLVTKWVKKKKDVYREEFFHIYERWLYQYVNGWGHCDVLCYRILNPMVEQFPDLFCHLLTWTTSEKVYVRRAAPVSLLHSKGSFVVHVQFDMVKSICDLLKGDQHIHVQKGIGWLLKYSYLSYPLETTSYLRSSIAQMSRTSFRYALEKMPTPLRSEMMALK